MCDFEVKRGDVLYYTANGAVGSEQKIGRPVVVISSKAGNETSNTINACYLTSRQRWGKINIPVLSTREPSWVMCNQIITIDKTRNLSYMCTLSDSEMEEVDRGIMITLGLHEWQEPEETEIVEESDELFELRLKYDVLRELYTTALKKLAEGQFEKDLHSIAAPMAKAESEPKKLAEGQFEINSCSVANLRELGVHPNMIQSIMDGRPWQSMDDLRRLPGMTGVLYGVLVKKVTCVPEAKPVAERTPRVRKPVESAPKVNVNTATPEEMHEALGLSIRTALEIRAYRNKHGKFKKIEDLLNVNYFGSGCMKKYGDKICV